MQQGYVMDMVCDKCKGVRRGDLCFRIFISEISVCISRQDATVCYLLSREVLGQQSVMYTSCETSRSTGFAPPPIP